MTEHTPTPWEAQEYSECDDGVGIIGLRTNDGVPYSSPTNGLVAWATLHPTEMDANDPSRAQANAAFIIKAVNNHAALVKALQGAMVVLESMPRPTAGLISSRVQAEWDKRVAAVRDALASVSTPPTPESGNG